MKMKLNIVVGFAAAAVTTLMLGSCTADADSPGLEYMPDMYRSSAIEPYVDYGHIREKVNPDVKMKLSAMVPPMGTIPYYGTDSATVSLMLPYFRQAHVAFRQTHGMYDASLTTTDEYAAALADMNPLKMEIIKKADGTEENMTLSKGKALFNTNCVHCHGEKGDGQGPMVASGAYQGVPDYANLKNLSDGQMFYSIYYGKGMMGAHGSILNKKEIWTIIHYIRKMQDPAYGTPGAPVMTAPVDSTNVNG